MSKDFVIMKENWNPRRSLESPGNVSELTQPGGRDEQPVPSPLGPDLGRQWGAC
ncbi:hypothetical protein SynMINOS11_01691 [Synechococcus sp. Minos11]|nr:hypothetical protein SynMINOS11_01691 [Synechococcus sp. Minos11]